MIQIMEMRHDESASHDQETTSEEQQECLASEMAFMQDRWADELAADPAYSPNLSLGAHAFSLAWPPRVADLS